MDNDPTFERLNGLISLMVGFEKAVGHVFARGTIQRDDFIVSLLRWAESEPDEVAEIAYGTAVAARPKL